MCRKLTEIVMTKRGQEYCMEAKGHATSSAEQDDGMGEKVCSAVSTLTSTLALSLELMDGVDHDSVHVKADNGYIKVTARGRGTVKTLYQSACCGAKALQITHPDRVKLTADQFFQKISGIVDAI